MIFISKENKSILPQCDATSLCRKDSLLLQKHHKRGLLWVCVSSDLNHPSLHKSRDMNWLATFFFLPASLCCGYVMLCLGMILDPCVSAPGELKLQVVQTKFRLSGLCNVRSSGEDDLATHSHRDTFNNCTLHSPFCLGRCSWTQCILSDMLKPIKQTSDTPYIQRCNCYIILCFAITIIGCW